MFRRKTRNSTAYTGVGHASPAAQQPNNNAMAAALTIGQNLKQKQPTVYGKPNAAVSRSPSAKPAQTSSLLKRNSSFQATSTPRQSRANSDLSRRHSMAREPAVQELHIDDSFTDASFDQMGIDADNHYNNAARVSDLKLHHVAPKAQPKMVKKYIPTSNGIKIVEVPAETMKNDIARSNSMRSGLSLGRSGSLQKGPRANSLSNPKRQVRRPASRLSSIVSPPRLDEISELDAHPHSVDDHHYNDLQHQIEHEKQLAQDLEKQREEFLKLKELRLKNERKLRELQILQEEEASHSEESKVAGDSRVTSLSQESPKNDSFKTEDTAKPLGAAVVADEDEEDVPVAPVPFVVDEMESKQLNEVRKNSVISTDLAESDVISRSSSKDSFNKHPITTSPHDAVVNSYGDTFIPFEDSTNAPDADKLGDFGIEEIPKEYFDTPPLVASEHDLQVPPGNTLAPPASDPVLNESPSPSFDPVPEIIDELVPPANIAGSIRSFSSADSRSKPIKSAMKSSKTKYTSPSKAPESPANKAYLSLTTAENTRLNSKLSTSQLQEFNAQQELKSQNSRSQMSASQAPQLQTLRKQPSGGTHGSGFAGRSLRPQSMADSPASRGGHGGGMSSRSFKTQSTIQPIPPHNFHQSSSKLKAAELYAKANSRPKSEFQPLQRKSSFSREGSDNPAATTPQRQTRRTTLRSTAAPPHSSQPANGVQGKSRPDFRSSDGRYPTAAPSVPKSHDAIAAPKVSTGNNGQTGGFKSRFADSDDEESISRNPGFRSRFNDSDDEGSQVHISDPSPVAVGPQHKTLRESQPVDVKNEKTDKKGKEKKPKKKFLKKLFGRD